jgi:hypothetical protein
MVPGWFTQDKFSLQLGPSESGKVKIYATPSSDAVEGNKGFLVYVYSKEDQQNFQRLEGFVTVIRKEKLVLSLETDKNIYSPLEKITLKAQIKNFGSKDIGGAYLKFKLDNMEKRIILPILESGKSYFFSQEMQIPEHSDVVNASVEILNYKDELMASKEMHLDVFRVQSVTISTYVKNEFLRNIYIIKVKNQGNVPETKEVSISPSKLTSIFLTFKNKPTSVSSQNGVISYIWKIENLAPGESRILEYSEDYRIAFITLMLLLIIVLYFQKALAEPKLIKIARKGKGDEHKIYIHLKNSTHKRYFNVRLTDYVPNIAIITGFDGPRPKVSKAGEDHALTWELGSLMPKEERIFAYKLKGKIQVEGHVIFPEAHLVYYINGKEGRLKSNKIHLDFS